MDEMLKNMLPWHVAQVMRETAACKAFLPLTGRNNLHLASACHDGTFRDAQGTAGNGDAATLLL